MGCPWQQLHSLVQHLEATLPVILVCMAVEEQAIEGHTEREVILSGWDGGRSRDSEGSQHTAVIQMLAHQDPHHISASGKGSVRMACCSRLALWCISSSPGLPPACAARPVSTKGFQR